MADEKKLRLLLVDDEPTIIEVVRKQLEVAGFEVVVAVNGEEALSVARAEQPDAIILDLMLPKRSGLEVCMSLRKDVRFHRTPIIFYTGKGKHDVVASLGQDKKLLQESGADAFVEKVDGSLALIKQIHLQLAKRTAAPAASAPPPA